MSDHGRVMFQIVFAFSLMLSSCSKEKGPVVIKKIGVYRARDLVINVFLDADMINYKIKHGSSTSGPSMPHIKQDSDWLIYFEDSCEVWIYEGNGTLILDMHSDQNEGGIFQLSKDYNSLPRRVPKGLLEMLPDKMKNLEGKVTLR